MTTISWVQCPICGENDMEKRTADRAHRGLISCTNLECGSNGGTNFNGMWCDLPPPPWPYKRPGVPYFRADPDDPTVMIRDLDGVEERGQLVQGEFVPVGRL